MMGSALHKVVGLLFGEFDRDEFKKFLYMGTIFSFIIGSYWTMRALKNCIFCKIAGPLLLPWGKLASIIFLFPVVMIYTKMLDRYSREKMLYIVPTIYAIVAFLFGALILFTSASAEVMAARTGWAYYGTQTLAFAWYVFVESYGSLVVALFWAFASEVTMPDSAKKGFPLIYALGQVGAIIGPVVITRLPVWLSLTTDALPIFAASIMTLLVVVGMHRFLQVTPKHMLTSYGGAAAETHEEEPGFFEGLRLLLKHGYLFGIFFVIFAFEFIGAIFDFNFQKAAFMHFGNTPEYTAYTGEYAGTLNFVTLVLLMLGVSNITRFLGVGIALALVPLVFVGALLGFLTFDSLGFLFALMVGSKAINYALNGPALKQLYIPTSNDARFKAQAWIETFGSRASKGGGSLFNIAMGKSASRLQYLSWTGYLGFTLIGLWFFVALFLGKKHKRAIQENTIVC